MTVLEAIDDNVLLMSLILSGGTFKTMPLDDEELGDGVDGYLSPAANKSIFSDLLVDWDLFSGLERNLQDFILSIKRLNEQHLCNKNVQD